MFPQFFKNLSNIIDMWLTWVLDIDENIIKINNDKNIKHLSQDLIDITFEAGQSIRKPEKYYLVLEITISSLKDCLLFINFFNPNLMMKICRIELGKLFGLA